MSKIHFAIRSKCGQTLHTETVLKLAIRPLESDATNNCKFQVFVVLNVVSLKDQEKTVFLRME